MFESILNTVKSQLNGQLKERIGLNDGQVAQIVNIAGESIHEQTEAEAMSGNTEGLLHLFGSHDAHTSTTNPIVENMGNSFMSKIISMLGISADAADLAKNLVLPYMLKTISSKFTDSGKNDAAGLLSLFQGDGKGTALDSIKRQGSSKEDSFIGNK